MIQTPALAFTYSFCPSSCFPSVKATTRESSKPYSSAYSRHMDDSLLPSSPEKRFAPSFRVAMLIQKHESLCQILPQLLNLLLQSIHSQACELNT